MNERDLDEIRHACTYRRTMRNRDGKNLNYTIESVPLLSEKIPLPEGGEA